MGRLNARASTTTECDGHMIRRTLGLLAVAASVVACSDDGSSGGAATTSAATSTSVATTTTTPPTTIVFNTVAWTTTTEWTIPAPPTTYVEVGLPELREELLVMFREDQAERTGVGLPPGVQVMVRDYQRTQRLREIIAEHGWPTWDMVGVDGGTAAWVIAQHSDHDVGFQEQALALMRPAVAAGQADASEYAYLEDRVNVNNGQPQRYGTQVRCIDGGPGPSTPLLDEANIDVFRAEVGLGPLADYYATFPTC